MEEPKNNNTKNVYETKDSWNAINDVNYRLNLPIHRCTTPTSTYNTLKYLFYHMKCGIYVMIHSVTQNPEISLYYAKGGLNYDL